MKFEKGHKGYWLGKKRPAPWMKRAKSEEEKQKMGLSKKGKPTWNKGLKGIKGNNKGKHWKHTEEARKKKSEYSKELVRVGKHIFGDGTKTKLNHSIRNSFEYRLWRTAVFERDNYTCIWCGERGGTLNADHIKPFAYFPELRFAIDNGRTLCVDCHRKTDTFGKRIKNYGDVTYHTEAHSK